MQPGPSSRDTSSLCASPVHGCGEGGAGLWVLVSGLPLAFGGASCLVTEEARKGKDKADPVPRGIAGSFDHRPSDAMNHGSKSFAGNRRRVQVGCRVYVATLFDDKSRSTAPAMTALASTKASRVPRRSILELGHHRWRMSMDDPWWSVLIPEKLAPSQHPSTELIESYQPSAPRWPLLPNLIHPPSHILQASSKCPMSTPSSMSADLHRSFCSCAQMLNVPKL